jgi:small subunit ribosomal protein S2
MEVKELLDAGTHFGHPVNQWNPKMARYIYGERSNIYIIDLQKTVSKMNRACDFVRDLVASGGSILFVGTKRQAQSVIEESANACGMYYVNQRWLGGMLTNFTTIRKSVDRLKKIDAMSADGSYDRLPKKEVIVLEKERGKLVKILSGIRNMNQLPGAVFVVDTPKERICIAESRRLKIPIVAMVDTNSDPDGIDYLIPGNDDGIRSIRLVTNQIVAAILEGAKIRESRILVTAAAAVPLVAVAPPAGHVAPAGRAARAETAAVSGETNPATAVSLSEEAKG